MAESQLYRPISTYQTRILCLHGDDSLAQSPLRCDLYPADILDPSFGGIGVRSDKNGEDHVEPYVALSYAWGSTTRTKSIICNGVPVPITENLHGALKVLLPMRHLRRYIWIDALCIDQSNAEERSRQVQNMLVIYQNAAKVFAWLGEVHKHTQVALLAAASVSKGWLNSIDDFPSILEGLEDLYSRPWFRRMWVQQEIRAARVLVLCCGNLQFPWFSGLSNPELILPTIEDQPKKFSAWHQLKPKEADTKDPLSELRISMSSLKTRNLAHFRCFERFSIYKALPIDFVETLMITGLLQATDPKDYIYGTLGLTNLPARPKSLQEWAGARPTELHIPIDYSADLADILTTVSWLAVMKCGVSIIAKFKSVQTMSAPLDDSHHLEAQLPSWVIDWRLAAKVFQQATPHRDPRFTYERTTPHFDITIDHPWDTWIRIPGPSSKVTARRRKEGQTPPQHVDLMDDNLKPKSSFRKLIVRGVMATQYYAYDDHVWEKRASGKDIRCWHVSIGTRTSDVVVFLFSFVGFGFKKLTWESYVGDGAEARRSRSGGLWLLRPVNKEEYTLVACLPWSKGEYLPMYDHWHWKEPSVDELKDGNGQEHHRLSVEPLREGMDFKPGVKNGAVVDLYRFVIV